MGLTIDSSSPAVASSAGPSTTTASFTPPANSLLLVEFVGDSGGAPGAPSITDNLGSHLTYSLTDWQSHADSPTLSGQSANWTAEVGSSPSAMTVTVTTGETGAGAQTTVVKVYVLTSHDANNPVGAHGKNGATGVTSINPSYTAQRDGGQGFLSVSDFAAAATYSAGTGTTVDAQGIYNGSISGGFARRTTADDVNGSSNTINVNTGSTSAQNNYTYVEILPAATTSVGPGPTSTALHPGRGPSNLGRFNQTPGSTFIPVPLYAQASTARHPGQSPSTLSRFVQTLANSQVFDVVVDDTNVIPNLGSLAGDSSAFESTVIDVVISDVVSGSLAGDSSAFESVTIVAPSSTVYNVPSVPFHPGLTPSSVARFFQVPKSSQVFDVSVADTNLQSVLGSLGGDSSTLESVTIDTVVADTALGILGGDSSSFESTTIDVVIVDSPLGTLGGDSSAFESVVAAAPPSSVYNVPLVASHPGLGTSTWRFYQTPKSVAMPNITTIDSNVAAGLAGDSSSFESVTIDVVVQDSVSGALGGLPQETTTVDVVITDTQSGALAGDSSALESLTIYVHAVPAPVFHPGRGPSSARFYQTPKYNLSIPPDTSIIDVPLGILGGYAPAFEYVVPTPDVIVDMSIPNVVVDMSILLVKTNLVADTIIAYIDPD